MYAPEMFDMRVTLLEEGAAFTVRRSGNGLWDEIVIQLAPRRRGAATARDLTDAPTVRSVELFPSILVDCP